MKRFQWTIWQITNLLIQSIQVEDSNFSKEISSFHCSKNSPSLTEERKYMSSKTIIWNEYGVILIYVIWKVFREVLKIYAMSESLFP